MRTERPFFIVGSPRSGTTLLQTMFMAAPGIYIPPETKFLGTVTDPATLQQPIPVPNGLDALIDHTLERCRRMEIPCDADALAQAMRSAQPTWTEQFDVFLAHVQKHRPGCRRIGEKSPFHMRFVPELLHMFPDSRVITIIRDGRDSALSQIEAFPQRNIIGTARNWRDDQRRHARFTETLPAQRYTSVRYEDLVVEPRREIERLCAFLGEPFNEAMLRPHERSEQGFARHEVHKHRTRQPITASRISRYKQKMSRSDVALFQVIAGRELHANGYTLEPVASLWAAPALLRAGPRFVMARLQRRRQRARSDASTPHAETSAG